MIADARGGIPWAINILCDMALGYGFSCHADPFTAPIVEDMLQDKLEHGVCGFGVTGAKGPEPVEKQPDNSASLPAGRRLAELPQVGSAHAIDPRVLRSMLTVMHKNG